MLRLFSQLNGVATMSWICFSCDEIVYDEAWPHGDKTLCDDCYWDMREAVVLLLEKKLLEEE